MGESFAELVRRAVEAALTRLFPKFSDADQLGWNNVVKRAADGSADPLSAIGYASDVENHAVCREVLSFVGGAGQKGSDVRRHFSSPPYGWSRDAVDGTLLALIAGGFLRATRNAQTVTAKGMTQQQVAGTEFFIEGVIVSATHRIGVRKVALEMGLPMTNGEEVQVVPQILDRLHDEAQGAGGDAPLPAPPDSAVVSGLREMAGNSQVVGVAEQADALIACYREWSKARETARERLPDWDRLVTFVRHAGNLPVAEELNPQVDAIRSQRALLADPNPVPPLLQRVTAALRQAVSAAHGRLSEDRDQEVTELETSDLWLKLEPEDRANLLRKYGLGSISGIDIGTEQTLANCLESRSVEDWAVQLDALKTRVNQAREEAAQMLAPTAVTVRPTPATLNSREDVEAYIRRLREELLLQVDEHPVIIP